MIELLINVIILSLYFAGVCVLYGILYGHFLNNEIYPYKKAPLFYAVLLSVFIMPAAFVLFQINYVGYGNFKPKIVPNFKFKREKIQYCDLERLNNIWYCTVNAKFGPSIQTVLHQKLESIYKHKDLPWG